MLKFFTTLFYIAICCNCLAQWTMRPSFYNVVDVQPFGNKIVAYCPHAVFVANYNGDVDIFTKSSGLSGADISAGYASMSKNCFVVAYADGSADLVSGSNVQTINDVSLGNYLYERKVYHVTESNYYYIMSGEFGIAFVNKDFSGVYGVCRTEFPVLQCAVAGNTLWTVSEQGIYSVSLDNVNLQSPDNYSKHVFDLPVNYDFGQIVSANNMVYVAIYSSSHNKSAVYLLDNNTLVDEFDGEVCLKSTGSNLVVSSATNVSVYNSSNLLIKQIDEQSIKQSIEITSAILLENGMLSIGSKKCGMFLGNDNAFKNFLPNGPFDDSFNSIVTMQNRLIAGNKAFSILHNNIWTNTEVADGDFTSLFFNPYNYHHAFAGSSNALLYQFDDDKQRSVLNVESAPVNKVSAMEACPDGSLLVVVDFGGIYILSPDGSWHFLQSSAVINKYAVKSIVHASDYVFLLNLGENGVFAIDLSSTPTDYTDDRTNIFYPRYTTGERMGTQITAIVKDLDSRVWIGSNSGIGYLQNVDEVFTDAARCMRPVVTQSSKADGDYSQYLLRYAYINDICADAAAQKWIATNGAGVFAVSNDGTGEVFCFNSKNSPLPSDTVYTVDFMGLTGELFFSTASGLCSYSGDVEDAWNSLESVKVYPNPVRPDYDGMIYVSGLEDNTDVRITDLAGHLVFHTVSAGGKITWDGKNLRGNRCSTGVYLIFCVAPDTGDTSVKKLLIVD